MSDHPFTDKITQTQEGLLAWHQERAIFETTEMICKILEKDGVSRAELASRLGKTPGFISQLLDGTANMTTRTISDVFTVLGYEYHPRALRQITAETVAQNSRVLPWPPVASPRVDWKTQEVTRPTTLDAAKNVA
jgi:transcriptional regulator with XRE-family HTH domain